jgi:hypothetical protein
MAKLVHRVTDDARTLAAAPKPVVYTGGRERSCAFGLGVDEELPRLALLAL